MLKCRDRDAPVSKEGIIFRVMGYDHPPGFCICDVEYAPETIYKSYEKRALRNGGRIKYYKFYFNGGLKFIYRNFPQYRTYSESFNTYFVGLHKSQIGELRRPDKKLQEIFESGRSDKLLTVLRNVLSEILEISSLRLSDFGVFGSVLHDIYNVEYSDLDFIIYGRKQVEELRKVLQSLYEDPGTGFRNEYGGSTPPDSRYKRFKHLTLKEYMRHQRRKLIYAVYDKAWRPIKLEFEPVRKWDEIKNTYPEIKRVKKLSMVEAIFEVRDASQSYFMPSIYEIEILEAKNLPESVKIDRIISYVEEFRLQLEKGEYGIVKGWLEKIEKVSGETRYQITLTYGPKYFEQVLKTINYFQK